MDIYRIQKDLIRWYGKNQRLLPWRKTKDPYYIWVSEVMLQQTQVNTVIPYYLQFQEQFPDLEALARADLTQVLKAWEGLGYYGRARNFHKAARLIMENHQGRIPSSAENFRKLPGVGPYITAAVQSIAFNQPLPVVDGNVKRLLSRLVGIDTPVNQSGADKIFREWAEKLLDTKRPGDFNQAMMELGALICRPKQPDCRQCPLQYGCLAFKNKKILQYPKRIKPKPIPEYHIVAGIIRRKGHLLITRRKPEGLLGGLWEFPGGKIQKGETPETACLREIKEEVNLTVQIDSHLTQVKHAYTHFRIEMEVFLCSHPSGRLKLKGPVDYKWIGPGDMNKYPFPKANHKFFPALLGALKEG